LGIFQCIFKIVVYSICEMLTIWGAGSGSIVDVMVGWCAYGSASCLLKLAWYLKSEPGLPDDISELYR